MLPLGTEDGGAIEGGIIAACIAATFSGTLAVIKFLFPWLAKRKQERLAREDSIYQSVVRRLEEQSERDQAVISQQQRAIESFREANADLREESAELRAAVHFLYDTLKRHAAALKQMGHDPGDLPELPKMRGGLSERADFLARQASQSAGLGEAIRQAPTKPPEGGVL